MSNVSETTNPALVWLPMDHRLLGAEPDQVPFLVLGDKYARAVKMGSHAQPVAFPLVDAAQIPQLLQLVDGVMLTGSPSNVHPSHFNEAVADADLPLDTERDALTLSLVKACVASGVPLLGVCRGFQEINVALGGTLQQAVHLQAQQLDHRETKGISMDAAYAPAHTVQFAEASVFAKWAGGTTAQVNSLHGQGIGKLASGLRALGHAPDGLVEAIEITGARAFAYAVQWHPEWRCWENPFYAAIMAAFGDACRLRNASRQEREIAKV